jgi:hypothetical protein
VSAPGYPEPPEAQSIRSMLQVARILAIIFGVILVLAGIAYIALIAYYVSVCSTITGFDPYCGTAWVGDIGVAIWLLIGGAVAVIVYMQMRSIETKVNNRQYEAAKTQTLLWMILGFIFGIVLGIVLLIAFIKFDPLIAASRNMGGGGQMPPGGMPPAYSPPAAPTVAPAPAVAPASAPPPPPPAAGAPATPFCGNCGKPTTYVPQYGRYYCYDCKLYV